MQITNQEIIQFFTNFTIKNENDEYKKFPIKLAYAIQYNSKILLPFYQEYKQKQAVIINEHTEKDKNNQPVIKDDKMVVDFEACEKELSTLLLEQKEADIKTIDVSVLEKTEYDEYDSLSLTDMQAILFMVVDEPSTLFQ